MGRLQGKIALITGAASGIGLATARRFVEEGATVILSDIAEVRGLQAQQELCPKGERAVFVWHDVADEVSWRVVLAFVLDRFGRLDVLVNNAYHGIGLSLSTASLDQFRDGFRVTTDGVFLGMKLAGPVLSDHGAIVNLTSIAALVAAPKNAVYAAAKGAVRALSQSAALDFARDQRRIRVNAVAPGLTHTPALEKHIEISTGAATAQEIGEHLERMRINVPLGRIADPREIANAILFLASDEASFITGAELVADGGNCAK